MHNKTNFLNDCFFAIVVVVDCGILAFLANGQVDTSSGTTATYTCNTGYILNGPSSRTCGSDGVWSPGAPTCDSKISVVTIVWIYVFHSQKRLTFDL